MSGRKHDRDFFYKYTTFSSAIKIIESKAFRWSSPLMFNDPFDHQVGFVQTIDPDRFVKQISDLIRRMVFSDSEPVFAEKTAMAELVVSLWRNRERFDKEGFESHLFEMAKGISLKIPEYVDGLTSVVQQHLSRARVFCVTESADNVVMWSHYADSHRGVVFKLNCIDAIDNVLLAATRVEYVDKFVDFIGCDELVAQFVTGEQSYVLNVCWRIPFVKQLDWAYEREWRVYLPLISEDEGDGFSIFPENKLVFGEVYLGCRMGREEKEQILDLLKIHLPHVRVFEAFQSKERFALEFLELDFSANAE